MNKKIIILIGIVGICVLIFVTSLKSRNQEAINTNQSNEFISKEYEDMINNSVMYDENSTLEELKEEYKMTGENEIYEIQTESDGRKVIRVKADIKYQVAFCGMIKDSMPSYEELDTVFEANSPTKSGIWIKTNDHSKILSYLNDNDYLKSQYKINEDGYLEIFEVNSQTEYDKQIQKLINSNKQYLISISSTCYMIDTVTGEIVDNPYNQLDRYQTYDYCVDDDKMIIFVSENLDNKLSNDEIFMSVIDLLKTES